MNDEWTTVSDGSISPETKIVFEELGDEFIGKFLGFRELRDRETGNSYKQARFEDLETGEICFTRANWSMQQGLEKVRIGAVCRIVYSEDTDTGQASPMRSFTVMVRPSSGPTTVASGSTRPVRRANNSPKPKPPSGAKA